MFVCVCHAVTESQIRRAVDEGAAGLADLGARLGVAIHCGCCAEQAVSALQKRLLEIASSQPLTGSTDIRPALRC
ncbi:MAG: (2Fe-2S)-binding protein [Gammaproteobacteria bacterium]